MHHCQVGRMCTLLRLLTSNRFMRSTNTILRIITVFQTLSLLLLLLKEHSKTAQLVVLKS
jgi:hypothetical protein